MAAPVQYLLTLSCWDAGWGCTTPLLPGPARPQSCVRLASCRQGAGRDSGKWERLVATKWASPTQGWPLVAV